ncbi:hypothetical protein J8273_5327 [Carpediemonas membranifera]|uniref:Uncharacterized protein n=1 Tax=Carpediemonas membranifera TaxID=201153 RepID=A0A8J6B8Q5_9EUKA|nr:hypothetical protein J8273_5327 [Carpediemonas membranifera]|eukprot:KAG9392337.1 hypothetical protein J8273_5327 [Carpediemonas membranifera]
MSEGKKAPGHELNWKMFEMKKKKPKPPSARELKRQEKKSDELARLKRLDDLRRRKRSANASMRLKNASKVPAISVDTLFDTIRAQSNPTKPLTRRTQPIKPANPSCSTQVVSSRPTIEHPRRLDESPSSPPLTSQDLRDQAEQARADLLLVPLAATVPPPDIMSLTCSQAATPTQAGPGSSAQDLMEAIATLAQRGKGWDQSEGREMAMKMINVRRGEGPRSVLD